MKKAIILSLISIVLFTSCRYVGGERIRGNGNIKTETRTTAAFSGIDVGGSVDVYVTHDSVVSVRVETDENLMEFIETVVNGGILDIGSRDGFNLKPSAKIKVYVSGPSIHSFDASGACDIISKNKIISNERIEIDLSGASNVELQVQAPKIEADLSGAGTIQLQGQTRDLSVGGSGSTDIKCFDLMTENTRIHISGAGDAEVFASVTLDVSVSGAGSVRYKGNAVVTKSISGAGSVNKVD